MPTLHFLKTPDTSAGHEGEVLCCAFTPDGLAVLSGGWDGWLRLWDCETGQVTLAFRASEKPISACAISPDGRYLLSACLDGFLAHWDSKTREKVSYFLAHWRPLSAISFGMDGQLLATASWDRNLCLWDLCSEREWQTLCGHRDIVSGCRYTPDGKQLLSWSNDGRFGFWDVPSGASRGFLKAHEDRITAAAISPDGTWALSGSRDRHLKLWNLQSREVVASRLFAEEIRACFTLLDGSGVVVVDARGGISLHALPDLDECAALLTDCVAQCAAMSPAGDLIALGCMDGRIRVVQIRGLENEPLLTTPTQSRPRPRRGMQKLLRFREPGLLHYCHCPVCRRGFETEGHVLDRLQTCPSCGRQLRIKLRGQLESSLA